MALEKELAFFRKALPSLLRTKSNRGKFALVRGDKLHSIHNTLDEALQAGYDHFGIDPFLVKEIQQEEKPQYFSRNLSKCR